MTTPPRKVYIRLEYDGQDITDQISGMALNFTYTDNTGEADEIRITFEDTDGNWAGPWFPKVGDKPN
jgi:phage protein D